MAPPVVTTYTANFSTAYSLTTSVSKEGAGTVNLLGLQWFAKDEEVSLVATPETGYHFKNWTNPANNTVISKNNPLTITMKEPKKIKANIVRILILWLLTWSPPMEDRCQRSRTSSNIYTVNRSR